LLINSLDSINKNVYMSSYNFKDEIMKNSEFARWLKLQGVVFEQGKKHTKLFLNGKQSTLPRHAAEICEPLRKAIIKQLGLKE